MQLQQQQSGNRENETGEREHVDEPGPCRSGVAPLVQIVEPGDPAAVGALVFDRAGREIDGLAPDILWLAMGVPAEQRFVAAHAHEMPHVGMIKTSGGLFNFLSGKNSRAPAWMQDAGLEWLYRMALEPRRLFWRYFVTNPVAIWQMLRHSE